MARTKSAHCHEAILDAAVTVMEEKGYLDMSIEAVACRAKVGKQTVYRHFGSKPRLALETFVHKAASETTLPDTGALRSDLRAYVGRVVTAMDTAEKRRMLGGLLAEVQTDAELGAAFRDQIVEAKRCVLRTVFQRAIARGEVAPEADVDLLVDLVQGPLWYRMLISGARLDEAFADGLAAGVEAAAMRATT